ncbi:ABC transporter permease [Testudinibacter sp. TR-2022]|uniref:ABC transporter permease n=2 Tax=Testudinibacter sp. TR-2022 TaxID=2585029 RepID=UPI00111B73DA|nr:ABC transporter permease [Testudinibacter sp. TR-2022]TNH04564.1 ABC transporter permease [Testudinibacter sp. TR-2022]TNH12277.1 ABC transporter permease [Testudinibacter sp. TR-2022]TNH15015.1 ABC transporter permease [Testudinibacter sp. TR-2022]
MKNFYLFCLKHSTLMFFILMLIISGLLTDRFYSLENITNVLRQSVPLGIVSLGLLFVILTGGIDLSVGSIMALVSVVIALVIPDYGILGSMLIALFVGTIIGAAAGGLVSYFKVAPFVATLAMMTIARGLALIVSKGQPVFIDNDAFTDFGTGYLLALPLPFYVLLICFFGVFFVFKKTVFGRLVISIGSNEVATQFSGIQVERYKFWVYVICGLACALAGILATTRTGVGSPVFGIGFELDAIAAVVVGGASLSGGKGTVTNTLIGVLILSIISNLMNLLNIPGYHQQVVKGGIIILAVLLESLKNRQRLD